MTTWNRFLVRARHPTDAGRCLSFLVSSWSSSFLWLSAFRSVTAGNKVAAIAIRITRHPPPPPPPPLPPQARVQSLLPRVSGSHNPVSRGRLSCLTSSISRMARPLRMSTSMIWTSLPRTPLRYPRSTQPAKGSSATFPLALTKTGALISMTGTRWISAMLSTGGRVSAGSRSRAPVSATS